MGKEAPAEAKEREEANGKNGPSFWSRKSTIVAGGMIVAVLAFLGLIHLEQSFTHESTDDGFLDGQVISIAPKVAGQVAAVRVVNNQQVQKGDVLIEIDPRDLTVQLDQKRAVVESARANIGLLKASLELFKAQIATAQQNARQSASEADAAKANADKAAADLKRAEELIKNKTISQQEYDAVKAAALAAEAGLRAAQDKVASDTSKVAEVTAQLEAGRQAYERGEAQTRQAEYDVKAAELNLSYGRLTAPTEGYVTRKSVEAGDYVQVGQKLMALVGKEIWVTANFKETQVRSIRRGQPVMVRIDSLGKPDFAAHVDSIQAGSGAQFSLLPPENAVGSYVKVVQRVPIRILFDAPLKTDHVVGPGMSVIPSIRVNDFHVPVILILLIAIVLALLASWFWWRLSNGKEQEQNPRGE